MIVDPQLYALFLTAALLLTLAPGPDTLFVLGTSVGGGARGGLLASAGIMTLRRPRRSRRACTGRD